MILLFLLALLAIAISWLVYGLLDRLLLNYSGREQKRLLLISRLGSLPSENQGLVERIWQGYWSYWQQRGGGWLSELSPELKAQSKQALLLGGLTGMAGIVLASLQQRLLALVPWLALGFLLAHWPLLQQRRQHLRRQRRLQRELPNLIDGIRVLLGAGFSCAATIPYWRRFAGMVLLPYLQQLDQEAELEGLEIALQRFARRINTAPAQVLVSLFLQEMQGGIDIKTAIAQLSGYQRKLRWQTWRGELKQKPVYLALVGSILFTNLFILIGVPTVQLIMRIRQLN